MTRQLRRSAHLGGFAALLVVLSTLALSPSMFPAGKASAAEEGSGQGKLLLVLDSSGSMKEPSGDGRSRFRAAVSAMKQVVDELPGDLDVGLRIYGSKIADGPGSCKDSELVVPVKSLDRGALKQALGKAKPLGNTPIAYSLRQAANDLPDEGQRTIVLISDGEESCGGDPCQVARDLSKRGLDLRVDVVGFQVDQKARDQLTCIAQAGRGTFYDAPNAGALVGQLNRLSIRAARSYVPAGLPIEGTPRAAGAPEVGVGQYLDTIGDGDNVENYSVSPTPGNTLYLTGTIRPTSESRFENETLIVRLSSANGEECDEDQDGTLGEGQGLTPTSVVLTFSGEDLEECGSAPYTLTVAREGQKAVSALEVVVTEEPPVANTAGLPAASPEEYDARGNVSEKAEKTAGAPTFTAAPILEPGVYRDSILSGERLFYGVELEWGQQLVCDVRFGKNPALYDTSGFNASARIDVYGPTRYEMFSGGFDDSGTYRGDEVVNAHIATPVVRYLNRESGESALEYSARAGTYFCGVLMGESTKYSAAGAVDTTVRLSVVGEPAPGPEYVEPVPEEESPSAEPSPSDQASGEGNTDDQENVADGDDSGSSPLLWVLLVLALVAAAVGAFFARRRKKV